MTEIDPTRTRQQADVSDDEARLPPPSIGGEPVIREAMHTAVQGAGDDQADALAPDPTAPPIASPEPLAIGSARPPVLGAGLSAGLSAAGGKKRRGDKIFLGLTSGASAFVILIVVLVAVFLVAKSYNSIAHDKVNFLTSTEWAPTKGNLRFGVAALVWTTVLVALVALVIAVPISIGIALFITQYAPKRLARPVAYTIDLLAAIPSIIYGIWGYKVLAPHLEGVQRTLYHLGGFPLFKDHGVIRGSVFDAGVVLAVMILPIITAISRDVFDRTPRANKEAALALGSTKWEMIRMTVLPYGRAGVVSGAMLGLGRALGETIAVLLILSKVSHFQISVFNGGETIASKIAANQAEFDTPESTGAFIAAGLVLFLLTFLVNAAARSIVNRRKEFTS